MLQPQFLPEQQFVGIIRRMKKSERRKRAEKRARHEFSQRLRVAVERKFETQTALAKELEVTPQTVSGWLCGRTEPGVYHMQRLIELTEQPADYFISSPPHRSR